MGSCSSAPRNRSLNPSFGIPIHFSLVNGLTATSILYLDIRQHYSFLKILGHGSFGTVREAVRKNSSSRNEHFAVKSIPVSKVSSLSSLKTELDVLRTADHPNIVRLVETYEDSKYVHIVMELCAGGDLLSRVCAQKRMSERIAAAYMHQMCTAVYYLHSINFIHRDLKLDSFLFTSKDESAFIKTIDFGLSAKFHDSEQQRKIVGTLFYIAPEVINKQYGPECDVWSLGVVLYTMICGTPPFLGNNTTEIFQRIQYCKLEFLQKAWKLVSEECKDLIKKMMKKNPRERISMAEVMQHGWFAKLNSQTEDVPLHIFKALFRYHEPNKIQKSLMKIIIRHMSIEEIQELNKYFTAIDSTHSGKVSFEDLTKAMEGSENEEVQRRVRRFIKKKKSNEDFTFEYSDFIMATMDKKKLFTEELLQDTYSQLTNVIAKKDEVSGNNIDNVKASLNSAGISLSSTELETLLIDRLDSPTFDFHTFKQLSKNSI
jgi:calcium-dependent protein kinase